MMLAPEDIKYGQKRFEDIKKLSPFFKFLLAFVIIFVVAVIVFSIVMK